MLLLFFQKEKKYFCFNPVGQFFDTHWLQKAASIITEEKNIYLLQLSNFLDLR
jgi:hypothetical protein